MPAPRSDTPEGLGTEAPWLAPLLAGAALAVASCGLLTPFDAGPPVDAGADGGGDGDGDLDADGDGDLDGSGDGDGPADGDADAPLGDGGPTGPGPLTFIVDQATLIAEPLFDIDGDGAPDNMLADMAPDLAGIYVAVMNGFMLGAVEESRRRLSHFPWVADRDSLDMTDFTLIIASGVDTELTEDPMDPAVRGDDFSGEEPFYASARSLDGCGEPRYVFEEGQLVGGDLTGTGNMVELSQGQAVPLRLLQAHGTISDRADTFEVDIGGALLIGELGHQPGVATVVDLNLLESFLFGGAAFGAPLLLGLVPDLDLDGDGLETFELSDEGRILRCVDGDRVVIDGRDCWQDPRMADGFSLTSHWHHVPAVFVGREPGWETLVTGDCEDPPEQSLFDPP